ncbi:MAG: aminoacyl-histidine dipeptidase [Lachnospiraceae bacterium]
MSTLSELEPKSVFHFFEALCKIPRGTYNTKEVSDFCVNFAKERKLECVQDKWNNVIIKKAGTTGYENAEPVIFQGHLDIVCEKTEESTHDFKKDPIEAYVDGAYVTAKGTTLGADDGIAIAYALAILDSETIAHPPIEAVFTVDEEEGMIGAKGIDLSTLKGKMLFNIDSDVEGVLISGCAGGVDHTITLPIARKEQNGSVVEFHLFGLLGGHSGTEMCFQRLNASKLAGRILMMIQKEVALCLIETNGGSKKNVITSSSITKVLVPVGQEEKTKEIVLAVAAEIKAELGKDEPDFAVEVTVTKDQKVSVMESKDAEKVMFIMAAAPYGIQGYSRELEGLVETSLNLGVLTTTEDSVKFVHMIRSSIGSKIQELKQILDFWAECLGASAKSEGEYPAWQYKADSKLRPIMVDTYREMFGKEPEVTTLHAGLECGILLGQKSDLDCVSFGPNALDIHSVNERLEIASAKRMWDYILAILKNCK